MGIIKKLGVAFGTILSSLTLMAAPVLADSLSVDFESYSLGSVNGQDGWSKTGPYDSEVVSNTFGYGDFGAKSFRISNAITSGSFGDHAFSKSLTDEAGESTAQNGGMSSGIRQSYFEASWDFASTVPGEEQPGLNVVASPDRGDGARMSWIQMADTVDGLAVNFFNYTDNSPFGTLATPSDGCSDEDDFVSSPVVSGLVRSVPHNIRMVIAFNEGPRNDVVQVYVDGVLEHTDTTWEDYFRWCTESGGGIVDDPIADASRTVDSILFRTGGTAAPATLGQGFLIDNLNLNSLTPSVSTPNITSPANNSVLTSAALTEIDWTDSTADLGTVTYQYRAYSDAGYTASVYDSGPTLTDSEIPTPGTPEGVYYVQVRAIDSFGNTSAWSNDAGSPYKITVDNTPPPTTPTNKDQCKKDGWKSFSNPSFRNQGDCVSFVATKGRNLPSGN